MRGEFSEATAVNGIRPGRYEATIADGWDIHGNTNGGFLLALTARAMADAVGRPPLGVTAHYLAPGRPGPAEVDVEVHRLGRRTATASAVLRRDGVDLIRVLGTFGDQVESGPRVLEIEPPALAPYDECVRSTLPLEPGTGFGDRVVAKFEPSAIGFRDGHPTGTAQITGWFEFADRQPVDAFGLLLVADAFAPVVFNRPEFPVSWAPTLDLTVHVRGVPVAGPLLCRFRGRVIQNGMFEEDGEVWDSAGNFVAHSRQLALCPR